MGQRVGRMEGEHVPTARFRVQQAGEAGLRAGGLVKERERPAVRGQVVRQPLAVLARLGFDARQGVAGGFRLDDAGRLLVNVQQVIGGAVVGFQPELAHRHPTARVEV